MSARTPAAARRAAAPSPRIGMGPIALLIVACTLAIGYSVTHRIADPDLWQHLTVGRVIWERHAIPMQHEWTWPRWGEHEVLPSWLFRALLYPFHAAGGAWGLQAWRWLVTLGTFGVAAYTAYRMGARSVMAWIALVLAAMVFRQRSELRPETLAALLFAVQFHLLERARQGSPRALIGVPLVAWVWVNAHVSFWMGGLLTGLFLADALAGDRSRVRGLALTLAASVGLSVINPFGFEALAQPFVYQFTLRQDPLYRTIAELRPVDWSRNLWNGLPLLVVGWPLLALLRARRHGLDRIEAALLVVFLWLGLTTQRFVGMLAVAAAPFLIRDLAQLLAHARPWLAPWPRAAAVAALAAALAGSERAHSGVAAGAGYDTRYLPEGAADYIARAGVRGHGFNEFWQGGYLLWRFFPQRDRLPFMDIHQSGSPEDRALVARLGPDPLAFSRLDAEHHFAWVLTTPMAQLSGGLVDQLDADTTWRLVYTDDAALLYVRRSGPLAAIAERDGYRVLPGGTQAMAALGARVAADSVLRATLDAEVTRVVTTQPAHSGMAQITRANLALAEGRIEDAERALDAAIASGVEVPGLRERRAQLAALLR